jgi:hypothetical protein
MWWGGSVVLSFEVLGFELGFPLARQVLFRLNHASNPMCDIFLKIIESRF